jgi:broad-specificity NMP kinase
MAQLIVITGPPGAEKSTVARAVSDAIVRVIENGQVRYPRFAQ